MRARCGGHVSFRAPVAQRRHRHRELQLARSQARNDARLARRLADRARLGAGIICLRALQTSTGQLMLAGTNTAGDSRGGVVCINIMGGATVIY